MYVNVHISYVPSTRDVRLIQSHFQSITLHMYPHTPFCQMVVAGFSGHTDLSKAQEIRNEVRRVTNNLKESQGLAQKYNQRERLFGLPVTQVSAVSELTTTALLTRTVLRTSTCLVDTDVSTYVCMYIRTVHLVENRTLKPYT